MRKIFHLQIKSESSHKYYGSLSALCSENPNLGVSKFTLDRFDFTGPFENATCIIRKSVIKTTGSVSKNTSTNFKSKQSGSKETAQLGIGAVMPSIDSHKNWKDDLYFDTVCNCCICKSNFIADDGRQMCYECYSDNVS